MLIEIKIETSNAAFVDNKFEYLRILQELIVRTVEEGTLKASKLYDVNGNPVGAVKIYK